MVTTSANPQVDLDGLRQRNTPQQAPSAVEAKEAVQGLNAEELVMKKDGEEQRAFGRTPGGISKLFKALEEVRFESSAFN